MTVRHAKPPVITRAQCGRVITGAVSLWSLALTLASPAPRYDKVSQVLLLLYVLAMAGLPRDRWATIASAAAATSTFLLATAGVVAALSVPAAFSLLAGALLLGLLAATARLATATNANGSLQPLA